VGRRGDGSLASTSPAFDFFGATGLDLARDSVNGVAVQPNGQTVVAGATLPRHSLIGAARVNADRSLDSAFGNGGMLTTTIQGNEAAEAVLIQPDGKIIASVSPRTTPRESPTWPSSATSANRRRNEDLRPSTTNRLRTVL
jgi:hypothetical protein